MTIAWLLAGITLLTAGVLASLLIAARARIQAMEHSVQDRQTDIRARCERLQIIQDAVLTAIDDALLILDSDQRISHANSVAEAMFGPTLVGETVIGALRHPDLDMLISDAQMLSGDSVERRVEVDKRVLRARAIVVSGGDLTFTVLTLRDVTELQQLERARREMVSNVTHELSHPITAIGLLADTLLNVATREKPKRIRKMATDIRREADTLTQLVQEMRDLSLIESGQMPIRLTPAALNPLVEATIEQLQPLADSKNQVIDLDSPDECIVLADEVQVQRAIKNILHNAIKFSPDESHIRVQVTKTDTEAIIAVRDNGPGIPEEDVQRIFERFFQVDRARREGTGLGLAIVRHIARAHGGRTWATSTTGQGATLYFALALADNTAIDRDQ